MRKFLLLIAFLLALATPVSAQEITAPVVPDSGAALMPEETTSFGEGLWQILKGGVARIRPDIAEAARVSLSAVAAVLLTTILESFPGATKKTCELVGTLAVAGILLGSANSLVHLGTATVSELSNYGKLLLPVMTSALAAQGGITTSAALYVGTAAFNALLSSMIAALLVPMIYLFLGLATANAAVGQEMLQKMRDFLKWLMTWTLKTVLYVFTGYMGITGVVSGTTDAATLKAAKLTISGMVPVVGGILSDASEAVLVSAGVVKNAAGVYGILAILSVIAEPFFRIGVHYLILKGTAAVCSVFGTKQTSDLIADFTSAMGLVLAMTGSVCLLLLISTVCFLREVG